MATNEHEAEIKLTLDGGQFVGTLKKVKTKVKKLGDKTVKESKRMQRGIDGSKKSMMGLRDRVKKTIGTLAGLGAAFVAASAGKEAIELSAQFETLAFRVQTVTGIMTKAASIQKLVQRTATNTTRTHQEMAAVFDEVFKSTQNLEFTRAVMEGIGTTATGTGEAVEDVAATVTQLEQVFDISSERMGNALAQVFEVANKGGNSMQDLNGTIALMGATMKQAGLEGERGFDFMFGALRQSAKSFANLGTQVTGINNLMINLGATARLTTIAKAIGIKPKELLDEKDVLKRLRIILSTGQKGLDALKANFVGPEEQKALKALFTRPFEEALQRAKSAGLRGKEATEQALRSLDGAISKFGKGALTAADLQKRAAERALEPAARLRQAQNKLTEAFQQPEIIDAITALADSLPMLASVFANFLKFALSHPLLAGSLGIGGAAAKGFVSGMVNSMIKGHVKGGAKAAAGIQAAHVAGGAKASAGMLKNAGAFGLIAGAAMAAFAIGKESIDAGVTDDAKTTSSLAVARAKAGSRRGSISKQQGEAEELSRAIKAKKASQDSFMTSLFQGSDAEAAVNRELKGAEEDLKFKLKHIEKLRAQKNAGPDREGVTTIDKAPAAPIAIQDASARLMAKATATALGGQVLRVKIMNPNAAGVIGGASAGPGGSRGPRQLPMSRAGGAV